MSLVTPASVAGIGKHVNTSWRGSGRVVFDERARQLQDADEFVARGPYRKGQFVIVPAPVPVDAAIATWKSFGGRYEPNPTSPLMNYWRLPISRLTGKSLADLDLLYRGFYPFSTRDAITRMAVANPERYKTIKADIADRLARFTAHIAAQREVAKAGVPCQ